MESKNEMREAIGPNAIEVEFKSEQQLNNTEKEMLEVKKGDEPVC